MSAKTTSIIFLCLLAISSTGAQARTRSLGIAPDPACRASKLVVSIEQALSLHVRAPNVKIETQIDKTDMLLQYFVTEHRSGGQVSVQLDASVVGNKNGRLYGEGSVRSEAFADDESGRTQAAKQAAQRLGEQLSTALADALKRPGRARRIMLQISLDEAAVGSREPIIGALRRSLKDMSLRQRGSTERNLMMTLFSTERSKDLAEEIERAIAKVAKVRITWQVQTKSTLMLQISGNAQ